VPAGRTGALSHAVLDVQGLPPDIEIMQVAEQLCGEW
jgi:hypothetical protein